MKRNTAKTLILKVIADFSAEFGTLTKHSMFGGYGFCQNKIMFALVYGDKLYLRATGHLANIYKKDYMAQLTINYCGMAKPLQYYCVTSIQWQDKFVLKSLLMQSLKNTLVDKNSLTNKALRLKNHPNITVSLERLLIKTGITDFNLLQHLGAVNSYIKLKEKFTDITINVLFILAAAIDGCHVAVLPQKRKEALLLELKCGLVN